MQDLPHFGSGSRIYREIRVLRQVSYMNLNIRSKDGVISLFIGEWVRTPHEMLQSPRAIQR